MKFRPRALRWIRSSLLESDEEKRTVPFDIETLAFQLLKAWLCRRQRMRGDEHPMEATCNQETTRDVAYYCGQLMAVYVAIQRKAMPEVGVGVAERYYTAASAIPRLPWASWPSSPSTIWASWIPDLRTTLKVRFRKLR